MKCADIIKCICELCPIESALGWDNVGLLVGDEGKEIKSLFIAVDATDEIIDEAISLNADMIVTHHPMIFSPMKSIVESDFIGRRIRKLIKNDICYAAMHTNFDVMAMGYEASDKISLLDSEVLEETKIGLDGAEGIGRIGFLKYEHTLRELCENVKELFGLEYVKVFGDLDDKVLKVAISPGSGKSVIDVAVYKGADVLITGDIDHHSGIDANMKGLSIIDAGHYGIEKIFVQVMYEYLGRSIKDLKIYKENTKEPFTYI